MDLKWIIWLFYSLPQGLCYIDVNLAKSFLEFKKLQLVVILTCSNNFDRMKLLHSFATENYSVSVKPMKFLNVKENLVKDHGKIGVVMNGLCEDAHNFLLMCKPFEVFDTKHLWLVFYNSSDYHNLFLNVNLNVDSYINVAYPQRDINISTKYIIEDVYNPAQQNGGELKSSTVGFYDNIQGYSVDESQNRYCLRKNLTGVQFKSIIVLSEPFDPPLTDYLETDANIEVDTLNRFNARLMKYCQEYYNFSVDIINTTNSWGYFQPDGTMDGIIGALEMKEIDFGYSPFIAKTERVPFLQFGKGTWKLRTTFILKNPDNARPFEIFTKPFSFYVWICFIMTTCLMLISQKLSFWMDYYENRDTDVSWSFSCLCVFGSFCQQGVTGFPSTIGGRTSTYTCLILGFLIYQFYSSSLISFLLNVPVTVLKTVQEILDSDFKIGFENVKYAVSILKQAKGHEAAEVLKLVSKNNDSGFLRRDEGMTLVKHGQFAFHVELVTAYPFMETQFDQTLICKLRFIPLFSPTLMYLGYQKWSHFKDIIDTCILRFAENGVMDRELKFWHPRTPECVRMPSMIELGTGLEEFYPALIILFMGMIISLQILVVEYLYHLNAQSRRRFP